MCRITLRCTSVVDPAASTCGLGLHFKSLPGKLTVGITHASTPQRQVQVVAGGARVLKTLFAVYRAVPAQHAHVVWATVS